MEASEAVDNPGYRDLGESSHL